MAKRMTQAEANYRRGDPINSCGVCRFYQGHHRCSQVMGVISPYGLSDPYRPEQNPFGKTLSPQDIQAIKSIAANAAAKAGQGQGQAAGGGAMPGDNDQDEAA